MKENQTSRAELNRNLAQMLKGGVIMDVTTPEQARIAQEAGACAVMALERIPADIRAAGGVSRMSDPKMIKGIQAAVSIPVMAKCRIGHFVEAQILQAIEIDYIDESEVLSPADDVYHINKREFDVPFVCGARDLGEALRRISEGATMIRTKGEPGTGDVIQAGRHMRAMQSEIHRLTTLNEDELYEAAKELRSPYELVKYVHDNGKLPVVNFAAGGVATPADAALMMQLGAEGVFVGSGIFKSGNPAKRARAIVQAVTNYKDAKLIAELSEDLGEAMVGINESEIEILMAERGKEIPYNMNIAVLALQGAFAEHRAMLERLGAQTFEIRQASDWQKPKDGLVIPGGESTVIIKLLHELGLFAEIKESIERGLPLFGTCAGLISVAKRVENSAGEPERFGGPEIFYPGLATMNICACRNAYGRQLGSFYTEAPMLISSQEHILPMTFIRAPYIKEVGEGVKVLATVDGKIVAAQQGNQLVTAFHPELNHDTTIHQHFLTLCRRYTHRPVVPRPAGGGRHSE